MGRDHLTVGVNRLIAVGQDRERRFGGVGLGVSQKFSRLVDPSGPGRNEGGFGQERGPPVPLGAQLRGLPQPLDSGRKSAQPKG